VFEQQKKTNKNKKTKQEKKNESTLKIKTHETNKETIKHTERLPKKNGMQSNKKKIIPLRPHPLRPPCIHK